VKLLQQGQLPSATVAVHGARHALAADRWKSTGFRRSTPRAAARTIAATRQRVFAALAPAGAAQPQHDRFRPGPPGGDRPPARLALRQRARLVQIRVLTHPTLRLDEHPDSRSVATGSTVGCVRGAIEARHSHCRGQTGTLTEGKPKLVAVVPQAGQDEAVVLRLAAAWSRQRTPAGERDRGGGRGARRDLLKPVTPGVGGKG